MTDYWQELHDILSGEIEALESIYHGEGVVQTQPELTTASKAELVSDKKTKKQKKEQTKETVSVIETNLRILPNTGLDNSKIAVRVDLKLLFQEGVSPFFVNLKVSQSRSRSCYHKQ